MKYRYFSNKTSEETRRELENRALARKVCAEGIVLMENNGILPLGTDRKIALYGAGGRMTVKGGSGSGDVRERYSVNIETGLKNAGYRLVTTRWLDEFDASYRRQKTDWKEDLDRKMKGAGFNGMWQVLMDNPFLFPIGHRITEQDLAEDTDAAIYVVARQAGEGADRHVVRGDYLLDDVEYENIRFLTEHSRHTIVVINCGSIMDLSFLDEIQGIDALIYFSQGGEEGGNALADVISGKVSPSGKVTDTWGYRYSDYPSAETYSDQNGNVDDEYYYEDIYVGYRWFEAKGIKPRYPFGYGLSYTAFALKTRKVSNEKSTVTLEIEVENTGDAYAGKEVVQGYLSFPQAQANREKKALCAFAKTGLLAPGEKETVKLCFDMARSAYFDEGTASFKLEAGEYLVSVGDSSENAAAVACINIEEEIITERARNLCRKIREFETAAFSIERPETDGSLPTIRLNRQDFTTRTDVYSGMEIYHDPLVDRLMEKLSYREKIEFLNGGSLFGKCYNNTPGAVGRTTSKFLKKGIPNVNFGDGPAGLNVFQDIVITRRGGQKFLSEMPESYNYGMLSKLAVFLKGKPEDGQALYQFCTAWPAPMLCAQTWNSDLLYELGKAVGTEMLEVGITLWLAPGMNIHRNPLCGRHFEYYSEDPYLSGVMASAVTRGVQDHGGVGVTVKHFACNNQENNRNEMSAHVSERALREIYLKGFRITVEDAKPWSVMSSYNCINGIYNGNNGELLINILRNEWGFDGLVMSDWNSITPTKGSNVLCPKSGNDMIMPGNGRAKKELYKAYREGALTGSEIDFCAANILRLITRSEVYQNDADL
ncbi:MAG: glycoside hydrolase family 3 C-terminal domain-containing protein [Roseburia sp.]|nr:glycoside hydrolase family 3 C-terminal domain-containing protein [Roseburia sp.]MCM1099442.1 glycoside hydrolase family 3 C-terminal domain-containing protein [Ruminococcus flavefaciens]